MDPSALGRYLRESRETKEITLEEAVVALRIRRNVLEAFERGEFDLGDSPVRVRGMLRNYALNFVFIQFIGDPNSLERGAFGGLALANASTTVVEALVLWWLMRRRIGGINDSYILSGSAKATIAALLMGIVLWLLYFLPVQGIWLALLGGGLGALVYFGFSIMLGLEEAKAVPAMLMRRFRR